MILHREPERQKLKLMLKLGEITVEKVQGLSLNFKSKNVRTGGQSTSIFSLVNLNFRDLKIAIRESISREDF